MDIANSGELGDVRTGDNPGGPPSSSFAVVGGSVDSSDDDDVGEDGSLVVVGEVRVVATVTGELCSSSSLLFINFLSKVSTVKNALFLLLPRGGGDDDEGGPLSSLLCNDDDEFINSLYPSLSSLPVLLLIWPLVVVSLLLLFFFFFFLCFFGKSTRSRLFGSLILPMALLDLLFTYCNRFYFMMAIKFKSSFVITYDIFFFNKIMGSGGEDLERIDVWKSNGCAAGEPDVFLRKDMGVL